MFIPLKIINCTYLGYSSVQIIYVLLTKQNFLFSSQAFPLNAVTMLTHLTAFSGPPEAIVKNKKYRPARTLSIYHWTVTYKKFELWCLTSYFLPPTSYFKKTNMRKLLNYSTHLRKDCDNLWKIKNFYFCLFLYLQ